MFSSNRSKSNALQPFRTPRDDAPPCNNEFWENRDDSYIYHLTQHYVQELRSNRYTNEPNLSTTSYLEFCRQQQEEEKRNKMKREMHERECSNNTVQRDYGVEDWHQAAATSAAAEEGEEGKEEADTTDHELRSCMPHNAFTAKEKSASSAYLHTYPETKPTSWLARLLYFFVPSYFYREQALRTMIELQQLSSSELLELMQMTLAAGEMERSSDIARELSLRRVNLTLQPLPTDTNRNMCNNTNNNNINDNNNSSNNAQQINNRHNTCNFHEMFTRNTSPCNTNTRTATQRSRWH